MDPRIETLDTKLIGLQKVISLEGSFVADLEDLYGRLFARVDDIQHIHSANRSIGYWHFVEDLVRVYFVGIQVDRIQDIPKGLVAWDLGETTWAIWPEQDGEEGTIVHGNMCWDWLDQSEYCYDHRFIGDFEVYCWETASVRKFGEQTQSDTHEVWIPVVGKEALL
jgi:predicted transcriptional regulator YdeE